MPRQSIFIFGAVLLFPMLVSGQTGKMPNGGMQSSRELAGAAFETYNNFNRAFLAGEEIAKREGDDLYIPSKYWAEPIRALNPIKVYSHRVNVVVVLRFQNDIEEGKYILSVISSYLPMNGVDRFEYTPNPQRDNKFYAGDAVLDYKRIRDRSISANDDLLSRLTMQVQNYSLSANNFLDALTKAAADFQIPMGVEWVDSSEAKVPFTHSWNNVMVEDIFAQIIAKWPGYEIQVGKGVWKQPVYQVQMRNGVLHVVPTELIPDRQNFLKLGLSRFQVHQQPFEMVSAQLHDFVNDIIFGPQGHAGSIASMPDEPKLDLDLRDTKVEEVLDKIIVGSSRNIWIVVFSGNSETMGAGFRRTLSLMGNSPIADAQQPVWDLVRWREAFPTVLLESK
jgi:hypothetical protein